MSTQTSSEDPTSTTSQSQPSVTPSEAELTTELRSLRHDNPKTGAAKLLVLLKQKQPAWSVSEKRVKKVLKDQGLMGSTGGGMSARYEHPVSSTTDAVDPHKWSNRVEVKTFDEVRGKGLVLNDGPDLEEGEILWKEEPWVLASDWDVLSQLQQTSLCAHCSCPLYLRNPTSIIRCDHCANASSSPTIRSLSAFCNRLCYSRAQSTYHPFLCPGQNPSCEPLLELLKVNDWSAPHSLARVTAKLLRGGKKDGGVSWESELKFFDALAAWSLEDKWRAESKEITAAERAKWKQAYEFYVATFHMPTSTEGKKKLAQVMKRQGPLPDHLFKKLFTYDAFMLNVGRINLNRESYGGLYFLHSHINHSCRPNAAIRHLDLPGRVTNPSPTRLTVLTLRTIKGGEEVTVSYIDPTLSLKERRRELRQWGIMCCTCERCVEEEKTAGEEEKEGMEGGEGSGKGVADLEGELRGAFGLSA
ncbi:hypothetical protein CPB86DRAFT_708398 [Serendipita vermifera]|nr:hypothetical protein CPB86DRAFT_708398 [Serendipita vermifera]